MIMTMGMGRGMKDATTHHASAMKSETLLRSMADEKGPRVTMGREATSGYGEGDGRRRFGHSDRSHRHHQCLCLFLCLSLYVYVSVVPTYSQNHAIHEFTCFRLT